MSEGHASAVRILRDVPVEGLEVRELHGPDAVDSILSDFTDLELVPIQQDPKQPTAQQSERHKLRQELKGSL